MANHIGRSQVIGIGKQDLRGTGAGADYYLHKVTHTEGRNAQHDYDTSALGVTADSSGVDIIKRWAEPQTEVYADLNSLGLLFWNISEGYSVSATGGETVVYDHVFKVGGTAYPENLITMNTDDPVEGDQDYIDYIASSFGLDINMNSRIMANLSAVSQYPASGTNTAAFTDPQYFFGRQTSVETGATIAGLSAFSGIQSAQLQFENNVNNDETAFELGNIDIANHKPQARSAEINLAKFLEDSTNLDYDKLATIRALQLTTTDTAVTLGVASNPTIIFTFPKVSLKATPGGDNDTRRTEELVYKAHYGTDDDEGADYQYKITVRNTVADYSAL